MGDPLGSPRAEWPKADNIVIHARGGCYSWYQSITLSELGICRISRLKLRMLSGDCEVGD